MSDAAPNFHTTDADFVSEMASYFAAPPSMPVIISPSTDPAVYMAGNYQRDMNRKNFQLYAVDAANVNAAADFKNKVSRWLQAGADLSSLPHQPSYVCLDETGFDQWWSDYCASPGNPPVVTFIKPAAPKPYPLIDKKVSVPPPVTDPIGDYNGAGIWSSTALGRQFPNGAQVPSPKSPSGWFVHVVYNYIFGPMDYWMACAAPIVSPTATVYAGGVAVPGIMAPAKG